MNILFGVVVVLFILFAAWREREARLERAELGRAHRSQVSELLTRIAHPEVALVPADDEKKVFLEPVESEPDELGMVGTIHYGADGG